MIGNSARTIMLLIKSIEVVFLSYAKKLLQSFIGECLIEFNLRFNEWIIDTSFSR